MTVPTLSPMDPDNACPIWMRLTAMMPTKMNTEGDNSNHDIYSTARTYEVKKVIHTFGGRETVYASRRELAKKLGIDISTIGKKIRDKRELRCGGTVRYA